MRLTTSGPKDVAKIILCFAPRGNEGSCKSCLPCFIAVVLDFDQRLLGNKDKTKNKNKLIKIDILNIWGRNLQGRNRKGPKPLGVKSEKGRNLWQPSIQMLYHGTAATAIHMYTMLVLCTCISSHVY